MFNALALWCIIGLSTIITVCVDRLITRGKWLSERNRLRRRKMYRTKAYAEKYRVKAISDNRATLWAKISK